MGLGLNQFASALQTTAQLADRDLSKLDPTELEQTSQELDRATRNPALNIVELLPEVGPEINYLRSLANITVDLLEPAAAALDKSTNLLPKDNAPGISIDFATYRAIAKDIVQIHARIGTLHTSLINRPSIEVLPIAQQLSSLENKLTENREVIDELVRYARIGEVVLAKDDQRWFIATQNLAEARATGGMIGSYVIIKASNNRIYIEEVGTDSDLNAMQSLKDDWVPDEIRYLYDYVNWKDWRDINSWPETEPVAKAIKQGWDDGTGRPIDGVLFMGQGITAQLVALAGGVTVDGKQLTGDNAAWYLASDIYLDYQDVDAKNAFVIQFSKQLFDKLAEDPLQPADFMANIKAKQTGDKLFGWVANPDLQNTYGKPVLQTFSFDDLAPNEIYFTSNNAGGNKLDAYLHYSVEQTDDGLTLWVENQANPSQLTEYMGSRLDLKAQGIDASLGLARNYFSFFYSSESNLTVDFQEILNLPRFAAIQQNVSIVVCDLELPLVAPGSEFSIKGQTRLLLASTLNRPPNFPTSS